MPFKLSLNPFLKGMIQKVFSPLMKVFAYIYDLFKRKGNLRDRYKEFKWILNSN